MAESDQPVRNALQFSQLSVQLVHEHWESDQPEAVGAAADDGVSDLPDEPDVLPRVPPPQPNYAYWVRQSEHRFRGLYNVPKNLKAFQYTN